MRELASLVLLFLAGIEEDYRGSTEEMSEALASKNCRPCKGIPPMTAKEAEQYLTSLPGWRILDNKIEKGVQVQNLSRRPGLR